MAAIFTWTRMVVVVCCMAFILQKNEVHCATVQNLKIRDTVFGRCLAFLSFLFLCSFIICLHNEMSGSHIHTESYNILSIIENASSSGSDTISFTIEQHAQDIQHSIAHTRAPDAPTPLDEVTTGIMNEQQIAAILTSSTGMDFTGCSVSSGTSSGGHSICSPAPSSSSVVPVNAQQVQSLIHELYHTKQLLGQYQSRTEYLMNLVTKQTNKISELRQQIVTAAEDNKKV